MSNTLTFHTTVENFKQQCDAFFNERLGTDVSKTINRVEAFSPSEFQEWHDTLLADYYDVLYHTIKNVAKMVRGDYDALTRDDRENDPLKNEPGLSFFVAYRQAYAQVADERVTQLHCIQKQIDAVKTWRQAEQEEKLRKVTVNGETFRAEEMCDVLWCGWECDATAWVVKQGETHKLVVSDHGSMHFAEANFLEERIQAYKKAIADSEKMLKLLTY